MTAPSRIRGMSAEKLEELIACMAADYCGCEKNEREEADGTEK